MRLQALKVAASVLSVALLAVACGGNGSSEDPPTGLKVEAYESSVVVSYDAKAGVDYWLFYAPTIYAPKDNSNMNKWFGLLGGSVVLNVTQPYTLGGLANGTSYSFTINGRSGGGPGGPGANIITATPRMAGGVWTPAAAASSKNLRALAYGSPIVAVGDAGTIVSTTDVVTWTAATSPTTQTLNGAIYWATTDGTNISLGYVAVGDAGTVLYSADGATWVQKTSTTTQNLHAVANNGTGRNVAVGAGGTIITSTDGSTWTPATTVGTTQNLYTVAYLAGAWYAAGAGGTLLKSTDALTWTAVATGSTAELHAISYGAYYTTASDGTSTTNVVYVLAGSGGTVLSSTDAATWTAQTLPGATRLNAVAFGLQFVALGDGGKIYTSPNGTTWTDVSPAGVTSNLQALVRGATSFLATGSGGTVLTSR